MKSSRLPPRFSVEEPGYEAKEICMPFLFSSLDHFTEGGWGITKNDTKIFRPTHFCNEWEVQAIAAQCGSIYHAAVLWYIDLWLIYCYFSVCISVEVVIWFSKNLMVQSCLNIVWTALSGNTSTLEHDTLEGLSCNNNLENSVKDPKYLFFLHIWLQIQKYMGESSKLWTETEYFPGWWVENENNATMIEILSMILALFQLLHRQKF